MWFAALVYISVISGSSTQISGPEISSVPTLASFPPKGSSEQIGNHLIKYKEKTHNKLSHSTCTGEKMFWRQEVTVAVTVFFIIIGGFFLNQVWCTQANLKPLMNLCSIFWHIFGWHWKRWYSEMEKYFREWGKKSISASTVIILSFLQKPVIKRWKNEGDREEAWKFSLEVWKLCVYVYGHMVKAKRF